MTIDANVDELTCQELVELVTDYLEDMLSPEEKLRFEAHIADCDSCSIYLDQMRRTIGMVGRLTEDSLASDTREQLLGVFRNWKQT